MQFVFFAVLCSVVLVLFNSNDTCFFWLYLLLQPLMHGVSSVKINFLLIYALVLSLAILLSPEPARPKSSAVLKKLAFGAILVGAAAGLGMFLSVVYQFQLPVEKYAYHFKNQYHTINYFAHTHATKVPLFYLTRLPGLTGINDLCDTALVLAPYVSRWLVALLSLSTLMVLGCCVALLRPLISTWEPEQRFIVFTAYTFATAHLVKGLLDGGPLAYDFIPSLVALYILFCSPTAVALTVHLRRHALRYGLLLVLLIALNTVVSLQEAALQTIIGVSFMVCMYGVLGVCLTIKKIPRLQAALMLAGCCAYLLFYMDLHAGVDARALLHRIGSGDKVLHYTYSASGNQAEPTVTDYSREMQGRRVVDVYRALGDNPFRNRNTAIFLPGKPRMNAYIAGVKVLTSPESVTLPSNNFIKMHTAIPSQRIKQAFLLKASFNSDLFPPLWDTGPSVVTENNKFVAFYYLNHYFMRQGISEYILVPYYYADIRWQ